MRKEKSCGAVIMRNINGKYFTLLIKHMHGHWGFPKGHEEEGEVKEETGLEVALDTGFRGTSTYWPQEDVYKQVVYFIGVPVEGIERADGVEIEQVGWFTISEAKALLSYPSDITILENAIRYLKDVEANE